VPDRQLSLVKKQIPAGSRICLVLGKFNVVHAGHLQIFRHAREICDYLIVGVLPDSSDEDIFFSAQDRLDGVRANTWVSDAFVLVDSPFDTIKVLKPHVVLKGKEHEFHENIEQAAVDSYGGVLRFGAGSLGLSASELLRTEGFLGSIPFRHADGYLDRRGISRDEFGRVMQQFSGLRALVIGDLILDNYVDCQPLGMSAEDPTIVVSPLASKYFLGGAGIVAAHAVGLGLTTAFISITGQDEEAGRCAKMLNGYGVSTQLFSDPDRPTTLKTRYRAGGKTLLRVNQLRDHEVDDALSKKILSEAMDRLSEINLLIFSDFSYGLLGEKVVGPLIEAALKKGVFIAADSQSSSQIGDITRFKGATLTTPTEREARLAARDTRSGLVGISEKIRTLTECQYSPITLGADGVFLHCHEPDRQEIIDDQIPALNLSPVDVSGAGDAFLVTAASSLAAGGSIWTSIYMGSIASAYQVSRLGNIQIKADELRSLLS